MMSISSSVGRWRSWRQVEDGMAGPRFSLTLAGSPRICDMVSPVCEYTNRLKDGRKNGGGSSPGSPTCPTGGSYDLETPYFVTYILLSLNDIRPRELIDDTILYS